jgi:hypothetical protein
LRESRIRDREEGVRETALNNRVRIVVLSFIVKFYYRTSGMSTIGWSYRLYTLIAKYILCVRKAHMRIVRIL